MEQLNIDSTTLLQHTDVHIQSEKLIKSEDGDLTFTLFCDKYSSPNHRVIILPAKRGNNRIFNCTHVDCCFNVSVNLRNSEWNVSASANFQHTLKSEQIPLSSSLKRKTDSDNFNHDRLNLLPLSSRVEYLRLRGYLLLSIKKELIDAFITRQSISAPRTTSGMRHNIYIILFLNFV